METVKEEENLMNIWKRIYQTMAHQFRLLKTGMSKREILFSEEKPKNCKEQWALNLLFRSKKHSFI